jgi:glutamate/tyrosine decarboxylase-like PLP-dependent enzyme
MKILDESLLDLAHRHAVDFLSALPERHVGARASRNELLAALSVPLTDEGEDPKAVLEALAGQAERGAIAVAGPRYFGFVIGGALPVTVAADWMVSTWDQNPGLFATSPLISVAEEITSGWILDLFGLPANGSVGFVTGCQMANFTCLAAARHSVLRRADWNVEERGLIGAPRVNIVVSAEAHVTIHTALRMLGFGTQSMIEVPTDSEGRMIAGELARVVENLSGPTIICAQAGNVNSGAVDPLRRIAELARERDAWMHVDGAFGLWAATSAERKHLVDGVELADSWATDGHKWLNVPYDSGLAITRHSSAHRSSMSVRAEYLELTAGAERDPFEYTPEFSRRARGIPVYAALRTLGRRGVEAMIDRCCAHARKFAELLAKDPRVKILNDVVLNQVLVRFDDDDAKTREVITRVQRDGTCWLGGTTWHGMAAMRISVSNWATSEEDVERSVAAILGA